MRSLEEQVRAELLKVRKTERGLTLATMTECPVLCGLLGQGDPAVALNNLKAFLLKQHDGSIAFSAAAASLGLASERNTHLGRLEEFGAEYGLEQRQVRRYSDRGIEAFTALLAKQWQFGEICSLTITISRPADDTWLLDIVAVAPEFLSMQPLQARQASDNYEDLDDTCQEHNEGYVTTVYQPLEISASSAPTACDFVWSGEVWPCIKVIALGQPAQRMIRTQVLGSHLQVSLQD